MEKTKVALVGLGTVGTGVARLLLNYGDRTARHAGRVLWLEQIVVANAAKPRDVELPDGILSDDLTRITRNAEISTVALLVGGLEPARTIAIKLLESGKDLVTANKALLAEHGPELFDRARELGRSISFEAAVAGGITDRRQYQPVFIRQSDPVDPCNPKRHQQFHPHQDGNRGHGLRRGRATGAAIGLRRGRPVDGRRRQRRRAKTGHLEPIGLRRADRLAWHSAPRHRSVGIGRSRIRQRAGLSHQALGHRAAHPRRFGTACLADAGQAHFAASRCARGAKRGKRSGGRGRSIVRSPGSAPDRCRRPRPLSPT